MPGFNNPGSVYGRGDSDSLWRIAEALEKIADNMEEANE